MADNKEGEETAPKGNEWEVVSLTASAYAAAPSPEQSEASHDDSQGKFVGEHKAETSSAMFMSGHFVFPPSQHENLPLEPEYKEKESDDNVSRLIKQESAETNLKNDESVSVKGLMSDEFPGIQIFDEKGNALSVSGAGADFGGDANFDKIESIYSTSGFSSSHGETTIGKSNNMEEGEGTDESIETLDSNLPDLQKPTEGDKYDLPCEAWWKRRAVTLYAHAKEANTLWSIFIAATVMGLVIVGTRWKHERWHYEKMSRMLGPVSRFKDVIVSGHRHGSLIGGRISGQL